MDKLKLKGSTLIEIIVAIIVITILSGIFFNFLTSINRDNNIILKINAQKIVDNIAEKAFADSSVNKGFFIYGNISVQIEKDSLAYKDIFEVTIKAYSVYKRELVSKTIYISGR